MVDFHGCHLSISWIIAVLVLSSMANGEQCLLSTKDKDIVKTFSEGNLKFALDLSKTSTSEENVFLSPFSISVALAMTAAGADGNTLTQMKNTMQLNALSTSSNINKAFAAVINSFCPSTNYTLSTANKIYVEQTFSILPSFINTVVNSYKSDAANVDFKKNGDAVVQEINKWVAQKTNNTIKDLFSPGSFGESTALVLVNAIYFKGSWGQKFDKKETKSEEFHLRNGQKITVPMMNQRKRFKYLELPNLKSKALELSYSGDRLVMYVILPDEINGMRSLQQQLNGETFNFMRSQMAFEDVTLKLPKFTLKYKVVLNQLLKNLGITDLFIKNKANLTKLAERELYVSQAIHQTYVDVDEEGTTAAGVTALVFETTSIKIPKSFIVDRPFMFFIYDTLTNFILFNGIVNNPLA